MNRKYRVRAFCVLLGSLVFALSFLNACKPPSPGISTADESAIYAAVIRRIYEQDDTYGGTFNPPLVYLVRATDDSIGDPDVAKTNSNILGEPLTTDILNELSGLPAEFIWVDSGEDVLLNPDSGRVAGEGVIITLGNIHPQRDGSVHISGSIYIASLAAGGQTYIVKPVNGAWEIVGMTGVQWIS